MKCTNKLKKTAGVSGLILASFLLFGGCASSPTAYTEAYEAGQYTKDLYRGTLCLQKISALQPKTLLWMVTPKIQPFMQRDCLI